MDQTFGSLLPMSEIQIEFLAPNLAVPGTDSWEHLGC